MQDCKKNSNLQNQSNSQTHDGNPISVPLTINSTDIVINSLKTDSNIIALSLDECDEYNSISFKIGKPLRSPIILSTLLTSKNILGDKKYRKVTIKNVDDIVKFVSCFYSNNKDRVIENRQKNYYVVDKIDSLILTNSDSFSFKNFLSSSSKDELKGLINEIASIYEHSYYEHEKILNTLSKEFLFKSEKYSIVYISNSLFLIVDNRNPVSGFLCTTEGLMIFLNY